MYFIGTNIFLRSDDSHVRWLFHITEAGTGLRVNEVADSNTSPDSRNTVNHGYPNPRQHGLFPKLDYFEISPTG